MTERFTTSIRGNKHRPIPAQIRFTELKTNEELLLVPEPTNKFDPNAIQVRTTDDIIIGYVSRGRAVEIGTAIFSAEATYKAIYNERGVLEIEVGTSNT